MMKQICKYYNRFVLAPIGLSLFWVTACSRPTAPLTGDAVLHFMLSIPEMPLPIETSSNQDSIGFTTTNDYCHYMLEVRKWNFDYYLEDLLERNEAQESRGDTLLWDKQIGSRSWKLKVVVRDTVFYEMKWSHHVHSVSGWITRNWKSGRFGTRYWFFDWHTGDGYRDWYFSPWLGYVYALTDSMGRGGRMYIYDYGASLPIFQEFFEATWDGHGHGWSWAGSW